MDKQDKHEVTEEMLHAHMGYGHDSDVMMTPMMTPIRSQYPLLTNGPMVEPLSMPVIVLHLISRMWFVTVLKLKSRSLTLSTFQVSGTSGSSTNSPEHHAIVLPPSTGGGKRVHPIPYIEGGIPGTYLNQCCVVSFNASGWCHDLQKILLLMRCVQFSWFFILMLQWKLVQWIQPRILVSMVMAVLRGRKG